MPPALYIDTSAFLRRVLSSDDLDRVDATAASYTARGTEVVSSRLLRLEALRVSIREQLRGNDIHDVVHADLVTITQLPVTDEVWALAESIEQHLKTLDSLHLATCELIGADLLTFDHTMRAVAQQRGIALAY